MKANKKTMIAAALAVAVVALAGAGYAAVTSYKATTTNDGNDLESAYIKMTQGGAGAYSTDFFTKIYFDTANTTNADTINYTPKYDSIVDADGAVLNLDPASGANCALVSKVLTLTIAKTNTKETSATFTVTADNCTDITGLKYTMVLVKTGQAAGTYSYKADASAVSGGVRTWSFGSIDLNSDTTGTGTYDIVYTAYLFVSLSGSTPVSTSSGIDTAGFGSEDNKSTFTFTAEVTITNTGS